MTGSSGRQRVPSSCFDNYLIAVPPEHIANEFQAAVRPLMQLVKVNSEANATLTALRDTLLLKLISGEIRVKDAEQLVERAV
jgi:type I restriction enzyme S subunit